MTISSFLFFVLAILAAYVYRVLPKKLRNYWLLILSAGFIATWSYEFLLVLVVFALINYSIGIKAETAVHPRKWVITGIAFNIFFLLLFKYQKFYLPGLESLLLKNGWMSAGGALSFLVPVGLSFLVVQVISYLIDISNQRLKAERDLIKFGVYVLYFPKLLSGPIERARLFLPRLDAPILFDRVLAQRSLSLILTGLFRKMVFADPLFGMIPENAFITPQNYAGQHLFFWLLAYALALFNDFAGYTSIVRGVSLWFGIELANNFNLPYLSRNFTEFWNRWHISLSTWLRDYIFFPLSRSLMRHYTERNNFWNLVVPPVVTLLVSGLWHGLSWGLVAWGGLHGFYLVFERFSGLFRPFVPFEEQPRWQQNLGIALTFTLTTLAWIPFRMDIPVALSYLTGLFKWVKPDYFLFRRYVMGDTEFLSWSPLNLPNPFLLLVLSAAIGYDILVNHKGSEKELRSFQQVIQIVFLVVLFSFALFSIFADATTPFVYQGF
ncbi:MAG: hypothetical protein C0401_01720 [Anaerolinea sp.]|nr:hypothetical protein [Anaerolinea sp.]